MENFDFNWNDNYISSNNEFKSTMKRHKMNLKIDK